MYFHKGVQSNTKSFVGQVDDSMRNKIQRNTLKAFINYMLISKSKSKHLKKFD